MNCAFEETGLAASPRASRHSRASRILAASSGPAPPDQIPTSISATARTGLFRPPLAGLAARARLPRAGIAAQAQPGGGVHASCRGQRVSGREADNRQPGEPVLGLLAPRPAERGGGGTSRGAKRSRRQAGVLVPFEPYGPAGWDQRGRGRRALGGWATGGSDGWGGVVRTASARGDQGRRQGAGGSDGVCGRTARCGRHTGAGIAYKSMPGRAIVDARSD